MTENVALIVDGIKFENWESISISQGLTQMAADFEFVVSSKFPTNWASSYGVYLGAKCEITVGGIGIVNGYIDEIPLSYSASSYTISYAGRDKTSDLVDCCYDLDDGSNEWANQTPFSIIKKLCKPFDIDVLGDVDVLIELNDLTSPITRFSVSVGSPVYEDITKLCQAYGVLPYASSGNLWLGRAGIAPSVDNLEGGVNILSATFNMSNRDRFKTYYARGNMGDYSVDPSKLSATQTDYAIDRHRSMIIVDENLKSKADCQKRVDWEARMRAGKSRTLSVEVQGWTQANGGWPWALNHTVNVKDEYLGVEDTFLIAGIDYSLDDSSGAITKLTLVYPDTFKVKRAPIEKKEFLTFWEENELKGKMTGKSPKKLPGNWRNP